MLGRPYNGSSLKQTYEHLNALVQEHLRTKKAREVLFPEALSRLEEHAGENEDLRQAVKVLSQFNHEGALDNVPFELGVEHDQRRCEIGGLSRPAMSEFDVVLEHVSKTYPGGARAVIDFSAELKHGEFVAMLGPSGCGKTTTLRMVGGLEEVTEGKIFIAGKDVTDLPPALRDTSMMFQSFALFPHRTVFQNVEFSLKMKGMEKTARDRRVWEMLEMVGLTTFATRSAARLVRRTAAARRLSARFD